MRAARLKCVQTKDYNDLPLGRMSAKIQEQVKVIFQACRDGSHVFVPTSLDVNDALYDDDAFWLRSTVAGAALRDCVQGKGETMEGMGISGTTTTTVKRRRGGSASGDSTSVVGETDCLLDKNE